MRSRTRKCSACGHANRSYEVQACTKCGHVFLWRRSFGRKAYNRVTVYERVPGGPKQVLYWDRQGPHRETPTNLAGDPILDEDRAAKIGSRISEAQTRVRKARSGRELLGIAETHTVAQLFQQLHADRAHEWKPKYSRDQRRFRLFWEKTLGRSTDIAEVNAARISRMVAKEAALKDWSPKTQNHYLNAALETWSYAITFLKWLRPENGLEAVRRHRIAVDNDDITYEKAEAQALLRVAEEIDLRCAVAADLSFSGSRRLTAIRTLRTSAYRPETRIIDGGA